MIDFSTAGICLPLVPGLFPVLLLRHFLPAVYDHHQQLSLAPNRKHVGLVVVSPTWLINLLTTVNLNILCSDQCWFGSFVAGKTGKAANAYSWARHWQMLLVTSLLFLGQWGPPRLYSPLYHVHMPEQWKSEKLHVYVRRCLTTNTWGFRKTVRSILFSVFLCQHSLYSWYYWVNFLRHGELQAKELPVHLYVLKKFKKRILHSMESEIRCLPRKENLKWQLIFHFYGWHVEVSFQHLKNPIVLKSYRYPFQKYLLLTFILLPTFLESQDTSVIY